MRYDAIIVGGGIAGLISAAYLTKKGYSVLICEKEETVGGLVQSFRDQGFLFDAGVRGIVDSGIVKPMLKQLDIDVEFVKSTVTIGIENEMISVETIESLKDYREMLVRLYPEQKDDIDRILVEIRRVMDYMDVLYGIENPLFKDLKNDRKYLFKTLVPWLFRFMWKAGKIKRFNAPVAEYLGKRTDNQSLVDIISQHFFQKTPASFALSYFSLYLDYEYPVKGTFELVERIQAYILKNKGTIRNKTQIKYIDPKERVILDQDDNAYSYRQLIWAADLNQLYQAIEIDRIEDKKVKEKVQDRRRQIKDKRGGDSIYSLFLEVDLDLDYFKSRSSGHCFYTPIKTGQSRVFNRLKDMIKSTDRNEITNWMHDYLDHTTYEIAIPALRNKDLAPPGKTGLVVSVLMDYDYINHIKTLGFYQDFKRFTENKIIDVLNRSIYPGLKDHVIHHFSSSPLTLKRLSGNRDGAITGWAFTNDDMPAITKMTHVTKACLTPVPGILQAGQWTFSPSGLPISILTGKIAADRAHNLLKRGKKA